MKLIEIYNNTKIYKSEGDDFFTIFHLNQDGDIDEFRAKTIEKARSYIDRLEKYK